MDVNPYETTNEPDGQIKSTTKRATPDLISTMAAIGAPTYVVVRLITGGWATAVFYLLVFSAVGVVYFWMFWPLLAEDD